RVVLRRRRARSEVVLGASAPEYGIMGANAAYGHPGRMMAAATEELVPPKRIPVNGRPIRLRWLQQIIWSFLAANVGALIISALYYLFVQLRWHVGGHTLLYLKPDWDHLFGFGGWTEDRHDVRNVYEALLATLFVKSLLANWRKKD